MFRPIELQLVAVGQDLHDVAKCYIVLSVGRSPSWGQGAAPWLALPHESDA